MGYAPESRNALKEFLAGKGVSREQIEACGLVVHGEGIAVSYDRFRDRVMFPIEDLRGRIIAFGGRALSADAPAKYLNSPETELFHKGRVLYNGLRARKACQPQGGEPASRSLPSKAIWTSSRLRRAGIHHVVAPLGTALTEEQLELLWRISPEPILCFDGDGAGLRAAYRCCRSWPACLATRQVAALCALPEGQDPDGISSRRKVRPLFMRFCAMQDRAGGMVWTRETRQAGFSIRRSAGPNWRRVCAKLRAALPMKISAATQPGRRERGRRPFSGRGGRALKTAASARGRLRAAMKARADRGGPAGSGRPGNLRQSRPVDAGKGGRQRWCCTCPCARRPSC